MSRASELARARMITDVQRVPTIQPVEAVNRAKQGEGVPTKPTDPYSPNGVATVNGQTVEGQDSPSTALPDSLGNATLKLLQDHGFGTVELVKAASDDALLAVDGIGETRLATIRAQVK